MRQRQVVNAGPPQRSPRQREIPWHALHFSQRLGSLCTIVGLRAAIFFSPWHQNTWRWVWENINKYTGRSKDMLPVFIGCETNTETLGAEYLHSAVNYSKLKINFGARNGSFLLWKWVGVSIWGDSYWRSGNPQRPLLSTHNLFFLKEDGAPAQNQGLRAVSPVVRYIGLPSTLKRWFVSQLIRDCNGKAIKLRLR